MIVQRYMQFCAQHSQSLDAAFASLSLVGNASNDASQNPPTSLPIRLKLPPVPTTRQLSSVKSQHLTQSKQGLPSQKEKASGRREFLPSPSAELSTLLLSLRKLREAILVTEATTPVDFAQRVHAFSIRFSILARHPPSYFPSLSRLLYHLHSPSHPLMPSELTEFITYLILDYACREEKLVTAYELRQQAKLKYGFNSEIVDRVLLALTHDNWIAFWRARKDVDGYLRAVMNWSADRVRRKALKIAGSAYLSADVDWIVRGCTGEEDWTWEKLVKVEKLGWQKEGERIVIRKPKSRVQKDARLEKIDKILGPIQEDG